MSAPRRTWEGQSDLPALLRRCHDPALFADVPPDEALRRMAYLYAPPAEGDRPLSLRSRALALYDPFAQRARFPAGFRLCANIYTACAHACAYCYISGYVPEPTRPREKPGFLRMLERDLADLRALGLPPVPLHVGNSTDCLQEAMERPLGHALALLRRIAEERDLFSSVPILTKNPARLTRPEYLEPLKALPQAVVEVSLTFWDDARRRHVEPGAPSVASRVEAIQRLRAEGVRVTLRADPLFPRDPLPPAFFDRPAVADYGAQAAHTWSDLEHLISLAGDTGCRRVVISAMKVMCGRFHDRRFRAEWEPLYAAAQGGRARARGFAFRLPEEYIRESLFAPVIELGKERGVEVVHCTRNLFATP